MSQFIFESYTYDVNSGEARFNYRFSDGRSFTERIQYQPLEGYDEKILDRALFLAFMVIGTSYYKTFSTTEVVIETGMIDDWQAGFFTKVYQEGLSQFAFENGLGRPDLATFVPTGGTSDAISYGGEGLLVLQSGGKDSLLTAALLKRARKDFQPWYVSSSEHHPGILDDFDVPLLTTRRILDHEALLKARDEGARNGHVPVTYIVQSIALVQAVLENKNTVLVSIAHEGEEPHAMVGDLPITHQWSKTWEAEQLFAEYVERYVSSDLHIGSPLRQYSELRVAELFVELAWREYGRRFSSCNRANYMQGADNSELKWCGECPKCANAFLLFSPFLEPAELKSLFAGQDLFAKPMLQDTFKGLLGIDGVMKPFECVGEIDELRYAYHRAHREPGYVPVSFSVPDATFNYMTEYPSQAWARLGR